MPDQNALIDGQRLETVSVQLHDRRLAHPFQQVRTLDRLVGVRRGRCGA
jgi:hypothetical protein